MARKYLDDTGLAALWAKIVSKINSIGDAFVTIVGNETITGDKDFEGDVTLSKTGNYGSKLLNIKSFYNKSDAPQAADNAVGIDLLTRDNGTLTRLTSSIDGHGNTSTYLGNNGYDSNGNIVSTQDLILYSNRDGSHSVSVRHPEDWRSALSLATVASSGNYNDLSNKPTIPVGSDYVLKAGDTMTGDLTMQAASIREDFRNSAQNGELSVYYNEDKKSYSTQSAPREYVICTRDKNNWIGSYLYQQTSNQGCRTSIGARTYWSNGDLVQNMYFGVKVGTPYETPSFEISHPKLLLDNSTSIGKLTSGTGSKTSSWTASGAVTCNWIRSGHVVTVEYSFTVSIASGSSIGRWTNLFTGLPKPYNSSCWIYGEGGSPLIININGQLQNVYQWNSGSVFYRGSCTYLTDDFS